MQKLLYIPESKTYLTFSQISAVVVSDAGEFIVYVPSVVCKIGLHSVAHGALRAWLEAGEKSSPLLSFAGLRSES